MIAVIGDVHGNFSGVRNLMLDNPMVTEWLQVGDFGGEDISYEGLPTRITFIQGNHENWNELLTKPNSYWPESLNHLGNGQSTTIEGVDIVGLGGNYSAKFFDKAKNRIQGGRRRHFVKEEVDLAKYWGETGSENVDILLTHEAPSPYVKSCDNSGRDIGVEIISDLIKIIRPKFHIFGHHHYFKISEIGSTISIGLGYWDHGVLFIDPKTLQATYRDKDNNTILIP